jgi:hypothetical protein
MAKLDEVIEQLKVPGRNALRPSVAEVTHPLRACSEDAELAGRPKISDQPPNTLEPALLLVYDDKPNQICQDDIAQ